MAILFKRKLISRRKKPLDSKSEADNGKSFIDVDDFYILFLLNGYLYIKFH
jgi:hypothetical protein